MFIHPFSGKKRKSFLLVDISDEIHLPKRKKLSKSHDLNDNLGKCSKFRNLFLI